METMIDPNKIVQGDCLYWEDPDNSSCSKFFVVKSIRYNEDSKMITIETDEGDVFDCFAEELSSI